MDSTWPLIKDVGGLLKRLKRLYEYEDKITRLFPTLPEQWSFSRVDALVLGYFFQTYSRKTVVLDIGTFAGRSGFYFATQPKVLKVISVDPNPLVTDEIEDISMLMDLSVDLESFQDLRVLDLARAALAEFADERQKLQLHAGVVGSRQVGIQRDFLESVDEVEVPVLEPSDGVSLVAFVDGLHTKEGVQADLEAIFKRNPQAIAFLHDCRGYWGPFVQAGVANFIESSRKKYNFHLFEHLGPGLEAPNLGIVYSDIGAVEVNNFLLKLQHPLHLSKLVLAFGVSTASHKLQRILRKAFTA